MAIFLADLLASFLLHFRAILWPGVSSTFSCNFSDRWGLRLSFGSANEYVFSVLVLLTLQAIPYVPRHKIAVSLMAIFLADLLPA